MLVAFGSVMPALRVVVLFRSSITMSPIECATCVSWPSQVSVSFVVYSDLSCVWLLLLHTLFQYLEAKRPQCATSTDSVTVENEELETLSQLPTATLKGYASSRGINLNECVEKVDMARTCDSLCAFANRTD